MRNSFLAAALELRSGIPSGASPKTSGPDIIRAMTTELWLDFLGIRLDPSKATDHEFKINLHTPDNGEKFVVELSNATLTNIMGYQADDADLNITINREDLLLTMMVAKPFDQQIEEGQAKLDGDRAVYEQLKSMLIHFELGFEIMPGTGDGDLTPEMNPLEAEDLGRTDGG